MRLYGGKKKRAPGKLGVEVSSAGEGTLPPLVLPEWQVIARIL